MKGYCQFADEFSIEWQEAAEQRVGKVALKKKSLIWRGSY